MSESEIDHDAATRAIFMVIRRETLALAIAARTDDVDGAVVAASRLKWALSSAEQLIVLSDSEGPTSHARENARDTDCVQPTGPHVTSRDSESCSRS